MEPGRFRPLDDPRPGHWIVSPSSWHSLPDERLRSDDTRAIVERAIAELPERQALVLVLRDVAGWSAEDACAALALGAHNQRELLHQARSLVRSALEHHFAPSALAA